MIQVLVSYYKLYETWTDKEIYLGSNMLNMTRFICAYVMHIQLYPELQISLSMLQYALYNDEKFLEKSVYFPI
jgi:hypothetical protein